MDIFLDDRFHITATGFCDGWSWRLYDDWSDYEFVAPFPAKDQTTVILLAAEVIKERY